MPLQSYTCLSQVTRVHAMCRSFIKAVIMEDSKIVPVWVNWIRPCPYVLWLPTLLHCWSLFGTVLAHASQLSPRCAGHSFGNIRGQGLFPEGSTLVFVLFWEAGQGVWPVDPKHTMALIFRSFRLDPVLFHLPSYFLLAQETTYIWTKHKAGSSGWFSSKTAAQSNLRPSPTHSAGEGHAIKYLEKELILFKSLE